MIFYSFTMVSYGFHPFFVKSTAVPLGGSRTRRVVRRTLAGSSSEAQGGEGSEAEGREAPWANLR